MYLTRGSEHCLLHKVTFFLSGLVWSFCFLSTDERCHHTGITFTLFPASLRSLGFVVFRVHGTNWICLACFGQSSARRVQRRRWELLLSIYCVWGRQVVSTTQPDKYGEDISPCQYPHTPNTSSVISNYPWLNTCNLAKVADAHLLKILCRVTVTGATLYKRGG